MKLLHVAVMFASAAIVASYPTNINSRVENVDDEYGEHFEGDMLLTAKQLDAVHASHHDDIRNGLRNTTFRWPNNTVVYRVVEDHFDEEQIQKIEEALADIANKSCLIFRKWENEKEHAVTIQGSGMGCYSKVGYNLPEDEDEKKQVLNLAQRCFKHGIIVHEMLHTLGFYHMQSSFDRDEYIKIIWDNIKPGAERNFVKYNRDTVTNFGVPYDYESVMHYSATAFSKVGNATIIPLQDDVQIGQRIGLSEGDIIKLNKMYCQTEETEQI